MAYRIALFDADNTLLDFTRAEAEAIRLCLTTHGIPADEATVALYSRVNDRHWKRLEQGLTTRERLKVERFRDFLAEAGYTSDPRRMAEDYLSALSEQRFLMDGALALIRELYGRCRLCIVTNGIAAVQRSRFGGCPLAPYFDDVFISEELGYAKPDPRFFERVAAAIPHFDPAEALVIGDSLTSDIAGGIRAGLDTCWFNRRGEAPPDGMAITYTVSSLSEIPPILLS